MSNRSTPHTLPLQPKHDAPGLSLSLPPETLRPIITEIVREVLAQLDQARAALPDRLAYSEAEAARLLGLHSHQLRDERLRGRITASRIVGRQMRYQREDLVAYLMRERVNGAD
jgi:hypothetical protein